MSPTAVTRFDIVLIYYSVHSFHFGSFHFFSFYLDSINLFYLFVFIFYYHDFFHSFLFYSFHLINFLISLFLLLHRKYALFKLLILSARNLIFIVYFYFISTRLFAFAYSIAVVNTYETLFP